MMTVLDRGLKTNSHPSLQIINRCSLTNYNQIMKKKPILVGNTSTLILVLLLINFNQVTAQKKVEKLQVSLQQRVPSQLDKGATILTNRIEEWDMTETAVIICDMWDRHWCVEATDRVAEMAPELNSVVEIARGRGAMIVHAPSGTMDFYKDHPGRKLAMRYTNKKVASKIVEEEKLESEQVASWPFQISNGGCMASPGDAPENESVWKRQISTIDILEGDAISDSGVEIGSLFAKKGIKNVILTGVHTNMCVIGRTFGLRNMKRLGMNVVLMRDLTDTMYDSTSEPFVSHFTGNSLMCEYIEEFVCPTMVSTDITAEKQFRFQDDNRPIIAFVIAESEYRADQRLPEFAHELLLNKNVNCEFALGKPIMEGEGRHNIENLQIMEDTDLAVLFIRRRALEPNKMNLIQNYVKSGKPVLGIRTASHAFDPKGNVPREGGVIEKAKGTVDDFLSNWTDFDLEVLGGNYQGHHGHLNEGTKISIIPGMQGNSILKGVEVNGFTSANWLYINSPLRSNTVQVLLEGTIPNHPSEPVFWINTNQYGKAIYTSMGHWDDWEIPSFKNLMFNSIDYLLNHTKNN